MDWRTPREDRRHLLETTVPWGSPELDARLAAALAPDADTPDELRADLITALERIDREQRQAGRDVAALLDRVAVAARRAAALAREEDAARSREAEQRRQAAAVVKALHDRVARVRLCAEQHGLELEAPAMTGKQAAAAARGRFRLTCAAADPRFFPTSSPDPFGPPPAAPVPRVQVRGGRFVVPNPAGDTLEGVEAWLAHHCGFRP